MAARRSPHSGDGPPVGKRAPPARLLDDPVAGPDKIRPTPPVEGHAPDQAHDLGGQDLFNSCFVLVYPLSPFRRPGTPQAS